MDLDELFLRRQSCRKFDPERKVAKDDLVRIMEAVRLAPSACNSQPWSFILVSDPETAKKTADCVTDLGMNRFAFDCPAFAVVVEEKATLSEKVGMKFADQDFVSNDLGIAAAYYVLKAEEMGLSTCILGWRNEKKLRALFSLPESKRVRLVIATGYATADYPVREKKRKPLDEIARFL